MSRTTHPAAASAVRDDEIALLQTLLERLPPPLQPPDVSAIDGYLCGVLLQPNSIRQDEWLPWVFDVERRAPAPPRGSEPLVALVLRRLSQLDRAIEQRQWFDPWVFELAAPVSVSEAVLPWIAGFAAAMDRYPGLMRIDDPQLLEPLALLYLHFDAEDLEDAQDLQQLIDTLEPPPDLGEAVQDIVRSLMLIADVVRPLDTVRARRSSDGRTGRPRS